MKIIECPRDAMQGIHDWIPTEQKAAYINSLLQVGFDTLDCVSFVSPKAIPQLRDTAEVLSKLDTENTNTQLLAIVANERGARDAASFEEIRYMGYPFSISETFQQRNTNASIAESLKRVIAIQQICVQYNKELVVYISMGFGNPYGDPWSAEVAISWSKRLCDEVGVRIISLSDTVGVSTPENIRYLFGALIPALPQVSFGAHLHSTPDTRLEKLEAAFDAGCRRIDSAMLGFGGCPMAEDKLVGNMATEDVLSFLTTKGIKSGFNEKALLEARLLASEIFSEYH
jgi:hydroxymethylglutaryl-CoA lyase